MVTKGRIRISKDKAELARALKASENISSPFQTYADIVTFVAALGAQRQKRIPLESVSLKNPDPIPLDQFFTRGYGMLISLLAIVGTNDPKVLAMTDQAEDLRIQIFEEYANAGFEILQTELLGVVDYTEQILLMLTRQRTQSEPEEFDLTRFL
jgi:dnd system-associated protein 4